MLDAQAFEQHPCLALPVLFIYKNKKKHRTPCLAPCLT